MKTTLRRFFSHGFNLCFNHSAVMKFVGFLNARWQFLVTYYVGYSASAQYLSAYSDGNAKLQAKYKWTPFLAGIVVQNGKIGLKSFISATEEDFYKPENKAKLAELEARSERIRTLIGAEQKTFAGVLPGVLFRHRIIRRMNETEVVVQAVVRAIQHTIEIEKLGADAPIIILGGSGFIGRRVVKNLASRNLYTVDNPGEEGLSKSWPAQLHGQPALLVNVSRKHALKHYVPYIWKDLVLLNEVYPEPDNEQVEAFLTKGRAVYHLAGVKGRAFPAFPVAYSGCIPCSAAYMNERLDVVVKCLGGNSVHD